VNGRFLFWDSQNNCIRHKESNLIYAERVRRNGRWIWISGDPDIQSICREWAPGSTIGGIICVLEEALRCSPKGDENHDDCI